MFRSFFLLLVIFSLMVIPSFAVTYYEHFSTNGIFETGLTAVGETFQLNGKDILIFSGAFHYFRIHPDYWKDTFKKLRAAGLNTIETYMPWNLHNPKMGVFDFGDGGGSMSPFLNLTRFIQLAQEEDLFVILRPGPYICSEWDFGGLPSWLLRDPTMNVRSYHDDYRGFVKDYYEAFAPLVKDLLITKGGPIMAIQIENEFGAYGYDDHPRDKLYLEYLKEIMDDNGFSEALYFTSDSPLGTHDWGALEGILQTANFQTDTNEQLDRLKELQPDRPMMVMEFWTGWFDHWVVDNHSLWNVEDFENTFDDIMQRGASVNMYMFIGGTNFGFMAGANIDPSYKPDVSSYDYDAPLSEAGDYTDKYDKTLEIIQKYSPLNETVDHPERPPQRTKAAYGSFPITEALPFNSLINQIQVTQTLTDGPINMEALDINNGNGQSYGYTLYRTSRNVEAGVSCTLTIRGHVRDMAQVMINDQVITKRLSSAADLDTFGFWNALDASINFTSPGGDFEISILTENLGRVNYGRPHWFVQKKGLWEGNVILNEEKIKDWEVKPIEFKSDFVTSLSGWEAFAASLQTPSAYRAVVSITEQPQDTFLDMSQWGKGVVFLNGFNLGRFWSVGPTQTMYIPAPLLIQGNNEFVVFEQYEASANLVFTDTPNLGLEVAKKKFF